MDFLLHHFIDESAERDPDHEAFRFEGQAISYAELVDRSNRLATLLVAQGVKPHARVGIYMVKGLDLPVTIYGILKAGAAYVPIDPTAPLARIQFILNDCGIRHLVTNKAHGRKAARVAAQASGLDCVIGTSAPSDADEHPAYFTWEDLDSVPSQDPGIRLTEHDIAYVMYTSGSTGVPKGLMHTHHSARSYATLSAQEYGVLPNDRLGNHSPLHFDMSTFEYLTGPLCGATTVIIPEEATIFPLSLARLIEEEALTFWYSVPLALIQLLERGEIEQRDCSSLRWVLFGGEPFAPKHLRQLMALWPQARFSNSYGPAEVNQCTAYHLPPGAADTDDPIPLGRVWPGAEGLIVDDKDQTVTAGQIGELLIRAPTAMRGYWARPDLNREAFYHQPLFPDFEKQFYRTGDLVQERPDGNLVFCGRKDRLIKIRGYRVELDEVEAALNRLPGVAEAAAVAVRDADGNMSIIGAVLEGEDADLNAGTLRKGTAQYLSSYAVPARIEIRQTLPRTGSGKIDRNALSTQLAEATGTP